MKLRIISGNYGGRTIDAPRGHRTHPMGEQIRGALFNVLGDVAGLSVLDAFTGSGAIAIEAASRGAAPIVAVDSDKQAYKTAMANVQNLGLSNLVKVTEANISSWLERNQNLAFDIVICDPPYDQVKPGLLNKLAAVAKVGGIMVLSLPPDAGVTLDPAYEILQSKSYGDATLAFYRKTG